MPEYKVNSLMKDEPKKWESKFGTVWYHSVIVEGHPKPISVGKKEPNSIKAGDTLYGDIIETDYLEDKFKPSAPPQGNSNQSGQDDRGDAITASMVVKIAFQAFMSAEGMLPQEDAHWRQIDYMAEQLKNSIDKIKSGVDVGKVKEIFKEDKAPLPLPPEEGI